MSRVTSHDSLIVAARRFSISLFAASTLLLVACGGGSAGVGTDMSRFQDKSPAENDGQASNSQSNVDNGDNAGEPVKSDNAVSDTENSGNDTDTGSTPGPGSSTDETDVVEQEPEPAVEEEVTVEDELAMEVDGIVRLQWDRPDSRENGEYLEADEIDGYELRYRQLGEENFQSVMVDDGWTEEHELGALQGSYQFSIAAYDVNGLYSEFVSLAPVSGLVDTL